jgi:hypothetical protein
MSWFLAILVRGSHVDGQLDEDRIGDKLFRLVEAADAGEAYAKAMAPRPAIRDEYTDDDGTATTLEFLGLADLRAIADAEIRDGTEVYSELFAGKPLDQVVVREQLTVFTQETPPEEPEVDPGELGPMRASPIREGD